MARKTETLTDVGLGYIRLGQSATTLSAARRSASSSPSSCRADTGAHLYILDEPTTGLHFQTSRCCSRCCSACANKGNTIIVIEHNLDVIKTADWLIDMGLEGGGGGGMVVRAARRRGRRASGESYRPHLRRCSGLRPKPIHATGFAPLHPSGAPNELLNRLL